MNDAHSTLIEAGKRRLYDLQLPSIRSRQQAHAWFNATPQPSKPTQPPNVPKPQPSPSARHRPADGKSEDQRVPELHKILQGFLQQQKSLQMERSEVQRSLDKAAAALQRLKEEDAKDTDPNGWFNYFFGKSQSLEEKEARIRRMNERSTGRIVQESALRREKFKIETLDSQINDLKERIEKTQAEKAREERVKQQKEETDRWAEVLRQQQERQADLRRREAEARRAQEERLRKARETAQEEIRAKQVREEQQKAEKERLRKISERTAGKARAKGASQHSTNNRSPPCLHRRWWDKVDGMHFCEHCMERTRRFAFKCPTCSMVACAQCRSILKS